MTKHKPKIALRKETVRRLTTLDLERVGGGGAAVPFDSGEVTCPTGQKPGVATKG